MEKNLMTLSKLFSDGIYRIPDYQRGYAWTEKELIDFWEDISNIPEDKNHYFGMITVSGVEQKEWEQWKEEKWIIEDRNYTPYYVIDGQQRLTTCIIFIKSFIDFLINDLHKDKNDVINSETIQSLIDKFLYVSPPNNSVITTYKFGYEYKNPNFQFFKDRIINFVENPNIEDNYYTNNLAKAKSFFDANIKEYYNSQHEEKLYKLFKNVIHKLLFNFYKLDNEFNIFVTFETMNNRGKPLSTLELLKNRLIYLVELCTAKEDAKSVVREAINNQWQVIYTNLGKNKDILYNADDFLMAHWMCYYQFSKGKAGAYKDFLLKEEFIPQNIQNNYISAISTSIPKQEDSEFNNLSDSTDNVEASATNQEAAEHKFIDLECIDKYVKSLGSASKYWLYIKDPALAKASKYISDDEYLWLEKIIRLGMASAGPLILASYMNNSIKEDERVSLLKNIERFIFLGYRVGRTQSNWKSWDFYKKAGELFKNKTKISDINNHFRSLIDEWLMKDGYFDYSTFKDFIKRKYNEKVGFYGWNDLKYFLYEYECYLVSGIDASCGNPIKIEAKDFFIADGKDSFSIEHILPQDISNNYWQGFAKYDDEKLLHITHSLGNLLPLSKRINSQIQNKAYNPDKKERFSMSSQSSIKVSQDYQEWTLENIKKRGIILLQFMEERWNIKFKDENSMLDLLFLNNL